MTKSILCSLLTLSLLLTPSTLKAEVTDDCELTIHRGTVGLDEIRGPVQKLRARQAELLQSLELFSEKHETILKLSTGVFLIDLFNHDARRERNTIAKIISEIQSELSTIEPAIDNKIKNWLWRHDHRFPGLQRESRIVDYAARFLKTDVLPTNEDHHVRIVLEMPNWKKPVKGYEKLKRVLQRHKSDVLAAFKVLEYVLKQTFDREGAEAPKLAAFLFLKDSEKEVLVGDPSAVQSLRLKLWPEISRVLIKGKKGLDAVDHELLLDIADAKVRQSNYFSESYVWYLIAKQRRQYMQAYSEIERLLKNHGSNKVKERVSLVREALSFEENRL